MTEEAIRVAVAEACGWKIGTVEENSFATPGKVIKHKRWISPLGHAYRTIPDYLNDLNACHEMEKTLTDGQAMQFERELRSICARKSYRHVISATASHRAEAFLRTLGKWTESTTKTT